MNVHAHTGYGRPVPNHEAMVFPLHESEKAVLLAGLQQWGGPARPTNELAVALGFTDTGDLLQHCKRLAAALMAGTPLSALDWTRIVASAEINFASDVFGAGYEWSTCAGLSDVETIGALRTLQRKLVQAYGPAVGRDLGTGYPGARGST